MKNPIDIDRALVEASAICRAQLLALRPPWWKRSLRWYWHIVTRAIDLKDLEDY